MPKTKTTRRIIIPGYLAKFHCIGPDCPDHCCKKWEVELDKADTEVLRTLPDPDLAKLASQVLEPIETGNSDKRFTKIRFGEPPDQNCPFLSQERFCHIHAQAGEDYLPDTCHTYPRALIQVDGVIRAAATMSCPEAARLCLLDAQAMQFEEQDWSFRESVLANPSLDAALGTAGLDLHYLFLGLLQMREYTFWQRLALIAIVCHEVDKLVAEQRQQELPGLLASIEQSALSGACHDWLDPVLPGMEDRASLADQLLAHVIERNATPYQLQVFQAYRAGFQITGAVNASDVTARYQKSLSEHLLPFLQQNPHFLENLFLNQIFVSVFPLGTQESGYLARCVTLLIAKYLMLMQLLAGMAARPDTDFSPEQAVWAVQVLAKNYDHTKSLAVLGKQMAAGENPLPGLMSLLAEPR